MEEIDKMSEVKKVAEQIIMAAYKNGGKINYNDIASFVSCDISHVNRILRQYGTITAEWNNNTWLSYELNQGGYLFAESEGFAGIENERDKQRVIDELTKKNLVLQNDNFEYEKKLRSQKRIIRWWKVASAASGLIGIGIGLLSFFFWR